MRGLYRYLSPFTPDQSGALSVLFELGGLVVICDAGGCAGNVCGFDEPRFYSKKSAVFSACLRDMDAIMGRDDRLIEKTGKALASFPEAKFIAYIGTPVPSVIGTDFRALKRMAEKQFHLPVVTCATNGMDSYDKGEEKAYRALIDTFACGSGLSSAEHVPFAGVWGATPLELAAPGSAELIRNGFTEDGVPVVTFGMDSMLDDVRRCGSAAVNYAVSPAGLAAVQYLQQKYGTEYYVVSPLYRTHGKNAGAGSRPSNADDSAADKTESYVSGGMPHPLTGPVLVVHQQFMANAVRGIIRASCRSLPSGAPETDVATFFDFAPRYAEQGDSRPAGEDEFISLVKNKGYRTIIADPLLARALPGFDGTFIPLPHFAVSGQLHAVRSEAEFLEPLYRELGRV
ncbi:MAG TPA: nitrogenase molybdenum-iron protein [Treponema sp.]|nr:nitrogenase molybdenum-iron protein [Treponema sp.]